MNDLLSSFANTSISPVVPRASPYFRPWGQQLARQDSGSTINVEKDKYQIILDVQQFTPGNLPFSLII
jgi:crystallin alpha B